MMPTSAFSRPRISICFKWFLVLILVTPSANITTSEKLDCKNAGEDNDPNPSCPASPQENLCNSTVRSLQVQGTDHNGELVLPRRIILVRHGQSEGNVDDSAYTKVADPKIALTEKGMAEAEAETCGKGIREMIEKEGGGDDWKVYFYVSPYKRTLQTLRNVAKPFHRSRIAGVREDPRLREQDFGNFQDIEKMEFQKCLRQRYGRFFYRFSNGESAADVYNRITGFTESLRADMEMGMFQPPGEESHNLNIVIVSHGITLRVFLMRWFNWTVGEFERLYNLGNAKAIVMEKGSGGRYSLLPHHTEEELKKFGLTDEMLKDQEWQKRAKPGDINKNSTMASSSYFTHLIDEKEAPSRTCL